MTVQKSLVVTSEGVASKRNFFEASAPSKAEPLAARKVRAGVAGGVLCQGRHQLLGQILPGLGTNAHCGRLLVGVWWLLCEQGWA